MHDFKSTPYTHHTHSAVIMVTGHLRKDGRLLVLAISDTDR